MSWPTLMTTFQNPATRTDIVAGWCLASIYVTSGDAGQGTGYSRQRETGIRAAYAQMAGVSSTWSTTTVTVAGKTLTRTTLTPARRITLYLLRLPDGNVDGSGTTTSGFTSLQQLYCGVIGSLSTVDTPNQTYTRSQLVQTLGRLMTTAGAGTIRTLDERGDFDDGDHSDHHTVARLAFEARAASEPTVPIMGYLGYPGARLPANVSGDDLSAKQNALLAYAPFDSRMCQTLAECDARAEGTWLPRQHLSSELYTPDEPPDASDAAGSAAVTASSQNAPEGETADKAVDGVIDGYPGVHTADRVAQGGGAASWLRLSWLEPLRLSHVVLYDRPNASDWVTGSR
jgi:hypothetical protein